MKKRIVLCICGLLLLTSCATRPRTSEEDNAISAADKALFEKLANEQIQEAKLKYPQFTEREVIAVLKRQIYEGMSKEALVASWGKPTKITSSTGKTGKIEQYSYPGKTFEDLVFVYLEKNLITGWQK